jgi:hypothetical protein
MGSAVCCVSRRRCAFEELTMTPVETVTENLPLILGLIVLGLFLVGLVLGLRTEGGRGRLARAAVQLAVAALGLAERWLAGQMEPRVSDGSIQYARGELRHWLARREAER